MAEPTYHLTRDAVVWATEGSETLALDLDSGTYLGVNSSGTLLWNALQAGATPEDLINTLTKTYAVTIERASADVTAFLDACRSRGFLAE